MFNFNVFFSVLQSYVRGVCAWLCKVFINFEKKLIKTSDLLDYNNNIYVFKRVLNFFFNVFNEAPFNLDNKKIEKTQLDNLDFDVLQSVFSKFLFFKSFQKKFNTNFDEVKFLFYMRYSFFINETFFYENFKNYRNKLLMLDEKFYNDFHVLYILICVFCSEILYAKNFLTRISVILLLSNLVFFLYYVFKRFVFLFLFNLFLKFVFFVDFFFSYFILNYKKLIIFDYVIMFLYAIFYMLYIWIVLLNNFFFRFLNLFNLHFVRYKIDLINAVFFSKLSLFVNYWLFGGVLDSRSKFTFNWGDLFIKNEVIFSEYAGGLKRTYVRLASDIAVDSVFCFWVRRQNFFFITASPWPFLASMFVVVFMAGFVLYFNYYTTSYYLYFGLILVFIIFTLWCRDFIRELILNENYSALLFQNFKVGFWLFIVSEFMLFFSFFWALFHSSFEVSIYLGMQWPPMDGVNINSIKIPFMNTILLVCSGLSLTAAQFGLVAGRLTVYRISFLYTVFHAVCFLISQLNEYMIAFQQANDSIYGSTMYMLTAFHGMHVFIGLCFLFVCFIRAEFGHMRANDILGFILAGWYWHFVDVVWIGVFLSVYVYGTLYPFILPINFEDIKLYEIRSFI